MTNISLVRCNKKRYWDFVLELRNGLREGFVQQATIDPNNHHKYMAKHSRGYWICLDGDTPVGFIGVVDNDIRLATHPDHQGKGIGKFMVENFSMLYPEAVAKVKVENISSQKVFEACGFVTKYYVMEKE